MKITITGGGKATDVTQYVTTVTWSGDYQSCARTLSFGILSSPTDRTIEKVRCDLMDAVAFDHNGRIFDGYIFRREKSTNESEITITCFDKGFYLRKITASYKFTRTTPETITRRVCADYGIQVDSIARTGFTLSRNFLGKNLYDIIQSAYTLASKSTGRKYQIRFEGGKLSVQEKGVNSSTIIIEGGVNLMDSAISESAENVVTRVKIYSKDDKFVRNVDNAPAMKLYGLMQEYVKQSEDDNGQARAKEILNAGTLEQKITVNGIGDTRCTTGNAVVVQEPYTGIYGLFYIDSDTHTWKNGQYYIKLVLNFRNLMDEKDAGAIEKASKSKAGSSSNKKSEGSGSSWSYVNKPT